MNNKNQKRKSAIKQLNPIIKTSNVMFRLRLLGGLPYYFSQTIIEKV